MAHARKIQNKRKSPATKAPKAAEIIAAQALAHPDLGPQRLALLLKNDGLNVSKDVIYHALRRRGLQTRELRRRFLSKTASLAAEKEAAQVLPEPAPPPSPSAGEKPPVVATPVAEVLGAWPNDFPPRPDGRPAAAESVAPAPLHPHVARVRGSEDTAIGRGLWVFRAVNFLLAGLAVLIAAHIATTLHEALRTPSAIADAPAPARAVLEPPTAVHSAPKAPLEDYHVIAERNLFGTARASALGETQEASGLAKIKLAGAELGLKLIGTTVSPNRRLNQAVIESTNSRTQELYHERERAGKVLIKRILRNNVIIATERGEQRLTVDYENVKAPSPAPPTGPPAAPSAAKLSTQVEAPATEAAEILFNMPRDTLAKSLANPAPLLKEMGLAPGQEQPASDGLRLGVVSPRNPLARLGMRTGDVIREFDGQAVSGAADVETVFKSLTEGGEFTVLVERRGRPLKLNLSID